MLGLLKMPDAPQGMTILSADVIVRVRSAPV
jgi:hypothetical protein